MIHFSEQIANLLSLVSLFLGSLFGLPFPPSPPSSTVMGTTTALVTKVIDGDTIDIIVDGTTEPIRVRYIGVDTPEPYSKGQPECGSHEATGRNTELVDGKIVTIVPGIDPSDTYGRLLAYVYVGDQFVNQALVAEGYASVMMFKPNTQYKKDFTTLDNQARRDKLGIWATCQK